MTGIATAGALPDSIALLGLNRESFVPQIMTVIEALLLAPSANYIACCCAAETCLAEPMSRWQMNSAESMLPPEMRQANVAEASLKQ